MQVFNLDISQRTHQAAISAKQGNVGQKIKVVLTNSGVAYPVPDGAALSVWYSGTSGEGNYSSVGEESAFGIDGNTVTVELITQMLTNAGGGALCLVINDANGDQIGLWNLAYVVEAVPGMGSQAAEQYYTAFSEAVKNLPYPDASLTAPGKAADAAAVGEALNKKLSGTDSTLTVSGQAADAAAVGAALTSKAPAEYGLGGSAKLLGSGDDLNNIVKTGWYSWGGDVPQNAPVYGGCLVEVINRNDMDVVQRLTLQNYLGAVTLVRVLNDTWSEWEWLNPPMAVGVEYRTTERSNGKAVYAIRVNPGSLVASGTASVTLTSDAGSGGISVLRYSAQAARHALPLNVYGAWVDVQALTGTSVLVRMHTDETALVGSDVYVDIWYTKD